MVNYYFPEDKLVFTGDTLFSMGCGRLFECDAEMMLRSVNKLKALPDTSYSFTIVAFDERPRRFSSSSEALILPLGSEETDPGVSLSVPTGLNGATTTANGQTQVTLTWTASSGPVAVDGYNVYRNSEYRTTVRTNAYNDTVPSGAAFSYSVVAFDNFDNYSSRSAPLNLLGDANQPPFYSDLADQSLIVGEPWELVLRPVDIDGGALREMGYRSYDALLRAVNNMP